MARSLVNPDAIVRVELQGRERQPIIIIDDLLAEPDRWRADAARARYAPIGPYYPGLRAVVPRGAAQGLREALCDLVGQTFAIAPVPPLHQCYYSIVTTPAEQLAPIQRLPHVDGLERERIAILIYLSGAEMGGTAFYRQRKTGFETIDADRFPAYEAQLSGQVAKHGLPAAAYIAGDTPLFEQVAEHQARPNRALIYRSHALHCAAIPPRATLPADPISGRLSINAFLFDPGAGQPQADAAGDGEGSSRPCK